MNGANATSRGRGLLQISRPHLQQEVGGILINIDKQKISQVVRNLLSNALKFTPRGGRITIKATVTFESQCERHADTLPPAEAAEPCPDCSLSPPYFRFEVTDTGPGISPVSLISVRKVQCTYSSRSSIGLLACAYYFN